MPPRDSGMTLLEIVISIMLMGTLVLAVVNAVFMSVKTSSHAYDRARVETVLLNAADRISRAPQVCDYEIYVDAAAAAEGWSPDLITVRVERLVANNGNASDWEPQTCPADVTPFEVQRLTISLSNPRHEISSSITVVKSDVS